MFPGEPEGIYYQYYYVVEDENSLAKKPSEVGIFFDIQWDIAPGDGGDIIIHDEEVTKAIYDTALILFVGLNFLLIIFLFWLIFPSCLSGVLTCKLCNDNKTAIIPIRRILQCQNRKRS